MNQTQNQKKDSFPTQIQNKKETYSTLFKKNWNIIYERKRNLDQIKIDIEKCNPYYLDPFWVIINPYRQNRPMNGVQKTMCFQHGQLKKLFLVFQPNFNQHNIKECWFRLKEQQNIIFYVDIDSQKFIHIISVQEGEKLISPSNNDKHDKQSGQNSNNKLSQEHQKLNQLVSHHIKTQAKSGKQVQLQIIFINRSPLCRYSSVFTIDLDQDLPQFISSDKLIFKVLKIFNLLPDINVAFNSLGGGASVNNLHFHLFFVEQMIQKGNCLPIQLAERTLFAQITRQKLSSLNYQGKYVKRELKREMKQPVQNVGFKVGVKIQFIDNPNSMGQAFVFSIMASKQFKIIEREQVFMSLSSVIVVFIDILVQKKIPFNILFTESGSKLYLMIRDYSCNQARFGFMEASGVMFGSEDEKKQQKKKQKLKQIIMQKELLMIKPQIVKQIKQMALDIFSGKFKQ